jgi:uncharacterized protein YbjT (DUF2867 family)
MKRHLVTGASGTVGSSLVELLKAQGVPVRATTSKKENAGSRDGTEWAHVDLSNGEGLREAFEGIDCAFVLSPPGYADQYRILAPLVCEARRRKLEKVVLMSAMGANADDNAPLRRAEIELEKSGLGYNIVRPNWFMQNFNTFWLQGIREQGKILLPAGTAKVSFIDARDIAAVAARLLTSDDQRNRDFDITGAEALDHGEVARILSAAAGRTIVYEEIEPQTLKKGLLAAGVPEDYADFLLLILGFLKQGYSARITGHVKALLGREPIRFEQYAQDQKHAWRPAKAA